MSGLAMLQQLYNENQVECRSKEAWERRKEKRKRRRSASAAEKEDVALENATYRELKYDVFELPRLHSDAHCKAVWSGEFAYPRGCGSFVDSFAEESSSNDVGPMEEGNMWEIRDEETGEWMYKIEGRATYSEGSIDAEEEDRHILNISALLATDAAQKRGNTKPGYGEVFAVGIRYRYTEPRNSDRQKLAAVALKKKVDPQKYYSALQHVQKCTAATQRVVANWSPEDKAQVKKQKRLLQLICQEPNTAGFTHPIVSGSRNGGFGAHWDPRDVIATDWLSLGHGALVFPSHEHIVYLQPGDVIRFNAAKWFHANMVKPTMEDISDRLREAQIHELQRALAERVATEADGGGSTLRGQESTSCGARVGVSNGAQLREERRAQAADMHRNADWMDQSIICLYYQSQQQSYMVNRYNKANPDTPIVLDESGQWQEAPVYVEEPAGEEADEDPHEHLSQYEIERRNRIQNNEARWEECLEGIRAARIRAGI